MITAALLLFTFQSVALTPTPKVQPQIHDQSVIMAQSGQHHVFADNTECIECESESEEKNESHRTSNIQIMDEDHVSIPSTHDWSTVLRIGQILVSHSHAHDGPSFPLLRPPRLS